MVIEPTNGEQTGARAPAAPKNRPARIISNIHYYAAASRTGLHLATPLSNGHSFDSTGFLLLLRIRLRLRILLERAPSVSLAFGSGLAGWLNKIVGEIFLVYRLAH